MTPAALFTRCGQFLCGPGDRWKEQLAAMLTVKTNTVDNWAKGTSRVPPSVWREIAAFIQDRESEAPTLHGAALQLAEGIEPATAGTITFDPHRTTNTSNAIPVLTMGPKPRRRT